MEVKQISFLILFNVATDGHFIHLEKSPRFCQYKRRVLRIFYGFLLKTKGLLPKVYTRYLGSERPLRCCLQRTGVA